MLNDLNKGLTRLVNADSVDEIIYDEEEQ
jgi:hypothetical protein